MKKRQNLKKVTLKELSDWIKRNKHVTWNIDSFSSKNHGKPGHLRGKYIRFSLDTRDMKIFNITLEGSGQLIQVDFRDGGEGTLLDELDRRLTEDGK